MYQLDLNSRSKFRYVAYFRSTSNYSSSFGRYFSVEIQCASRDWGTLIEANKAFSIEVCEIEEPETLTRYTLKERVEVASQNVVSELGRILVNYGVIPEGVPFKVNLDLEGCAYSFIEFNSKVKFAGECTHFQTVNSIYCDFGNVPINHNDEIEIDWKHFVKGTDRFEILKWFEDSFGYPITSMGAEYAM
jgi:hypothetical protein